MDSSDDHRPDYLRKSQAEREREERSKGRRTVVMENIVPFLVRAMTESDVAAVRQLETASFSDPWTERLLLETLQCPYDESWVLTGSRGEVCGYINLRFLGDEGELMRIAVAPGLRGQGLSRRLMDRMVSSAREKGARDLTLEVRSGNETAINLYKAYGFKREAVRRGYYRDPKEDAWIMWLRSLPGTPS